MTKSILDQEAIYQKLDSLHIYDSVLGLKNQLSQAWLEVTSSPLPNQCHLAKNIIIAGMGGSALGGRIIRSLDQYILNVPLEIVTNYRLPAYVNKDSLVLIISYSGNTEETISCLYDAQKRGAKIFVIASGGKIADLAIKDSLDRYIFDPKFNPSGQPRIGIGYSIGAIFALLSRCHFINFEESEITRIDHLLDQLTGQFHKEQPQDKNPAKILAHKLHDKGIILIAANHLTGVAHALKNMFNENSKTFSALFDLPELDHHFLEGLRFPAHLKDHLHFLLFNSPLYPQAIQKRLLITRQILEKNGYTTTSIRVEAAETTLQVFESLYFGEFVSFYLSLLSNTDPGPIPSVDFLKDQLANYE